MTKWKFYWEDREFTAAQRESAAESGAAMPDGSFPIKSEQDLKNAIQSVGRADDPAAAKAHIKTRAKALGLTSLLPSTWDSASENSTRVEFWDALSLSSVRRTADGYLTAKVRAARAGIQKYRGHEVGMPQLDHVRVYRPPEQVFRKDSMRSYAHRPITSEHPPEPVTADNWKKYAVGQTGDEVVRDGDYVTVPLVLMDAGIIKDWEDGKRKQLSLGYVTDLLWQDGTTPEGEKYDAVQTDIRANHLAVVVAARGGPNLRIGDDDAGEENMRTMIIDGITVELSDTAVQVVTKALETADERVSKLKKQVKDSDAKIAELTTVVSTKDAEIVTLRKQVEDGKVTPKMLDTLVRERGQVAAVARKLIGDSLTTDGRTVQEIRRHVVDAKLGATAAGWSDDQVAASFAALASASGVSDQRQGSADRLSDALSGTVHSTQDARDKAYAEYEQRLSDAWKPKAVA